MSPTPDQQLQKMLANIPSKIGRPLEQWLSAIRERELAKHGEILKWLKAEHGISHGFANLIAHRALNPATDEQELVAAQYAGAKAPLRPILDAIVEVAQGFGDDVTLAPKKASVSLRRAKQFALVQPSTKTRVDLGLQLIGVAANARLEASGSFSAMVSHRVRLARVEDVDAPLVAWLQRAYEAAR